MEENVSFTWVKTGIKHECVHFAKSHADHLLVQVAKCFRAQREEWIQKASSVQTDAFTDMQMASQLLISVQSVLF